jgi:hypothetical protein
VLKVAAAFKSLSSIPVCSFCNVTTGHSPGSLPVLQVSTFFFLIISKKGKNPLLMTKKGKSKILAATI